MAITVASLRASFTSDTADLEQGVARAARASDKAAGDIRAAGARSEGAFDGLSAKAVALGGVLSSAITGGLGLAISGFQSAISAGASFGETLNRIAAVGGPEAVAQLDAINAKALELGAKLPISAQQGADGMLALVAGGMSVEQALSAVDGVAGFAAAQMLDVGSAAEIVSGSLTSFGLGADKASFAADVMSQVANESAASVQDWGESIKYVGPVAGALKQPIEDMGVAIGLMANQSIKGSSAGTALRTMLTNLAAPSKEVATSLASMGVQTTNAAGQMLPFISIAEQMRSKMASMTDVQKAQIAETIAGKEGMSGFLAIVNAAPGDFDKMKQSMANAQGATEEFAEATNKGFKFEWGQLQGSIETVLIQGFQAVEPVLVSLTGVATGFVNSLGSGLTSVAPMLQGLGASIQSVITGFQSGGLAGGAASIAASLGFGPEVQGQVQAVMQGVQNAVAAGVAGLQSVVSGVATAIGPILGSAFQTAGAIAQSVLGGLPSLFQAIQGPAQSIASSVGGVLSSAFQAVGQIAQSVFGALPAFVSIGMSVLSSLASFVGSTLAAAFQVIGPIAQSVFSGIATVVQTAMPGVISLAAVVGGLLSAAFSALQAIAVSVFNAIQPYIPAVQAAIGSLASAIGGTLNTAFLAAADFVMDTVVPALTNLGQWLADNLPGAIQALANFWTGTLQPAIASVAGWITGTLFPALGELFGWLQAQLPGALQALANFWTGTLQPAIVQVAGWVTGTLFPMFGELVNWLSSTLTGALQTLSDFWGQHGDTILTIAQNTWEAIQSVIDAVFGTITGLWQAFQSAREGDWTGFGEKLRAIWDASWEAIKNVILSAWPVIVQTAKDIVADIQTSFTSIDWHQIGVNIIEGIGAGISSMANSLAQKAAAVAQAAKDAITGFFDMQSPSRVMADVGVNVMAGLEAGLDAGLPGVITTAVGGMRSLLEQINAVLDGIGGAISNSRFEKFRDAASALADGLTAISDAAKLFSGAGMAALSSVADKIRTFALDAKALLVSIDLSGIGAISNEKFEQFAAGLKELASGMASIASIGVTFASDAGMPNLRALSERIKTLAVDARSLLVALDEAILPISAGLPEKLKALGDAAAATKVILDNAMGMLAGMYAFASDSIMIAIVQSVGARAWFARLAAALAQFVEEAVEAFNTFDVEVAQVLTDRAARVAAGAEAAGRIVTGAIGMIESLFKFASTEIYLAIIASVGARQWFANLAAALGQFVEDALETFDRLGVDVSQELVTQASRVGAGADELLQAVNGAIGSLTTLFKFASDTVLVAVVSSQSARQNMAMLGAALGQFIEDALEAFDTFDVSVTQAMVDRVHTLSDGASALSSALGSTVDAITRLAAWMAKPITVTDRMQDEARRLGQNLVALFNEFRQGVGEAAPVGVDAARAWADASGVFSSLQDVMGFLPELVEWIKSPVVLTDRMGSWVERLAGNIVSLYEAFRRGAREALPVGVDAAQAWADTAGITSSLTDVMAFLPKLAEWIKSPVTLTDRMQDWVERLAAGTVALFEAFRDGARANLPTGTEAAMAWAETTSVTSALMDAMGFLPKLAEWIKSPLVLTDRMQEWVERLAASIVALFEAFRDGARTVKPTGVEAAQAWAETTFVVSALTDVMGFLPELAEWIKSPITLTDRMGDWVERLAGNIVSIFEAFRDGALTSKPTGVEAAQAWADTSSVMGALKDVMGFLPELAEWVKTPITLTDRMLDQVQILAGNIVSVFRRFSQGAGLALPEGVAAAQAWADTSSVVSGLQDIMGFLPELAEWIKSPITLTDSMLDQVGTLAANLKAIFARFRTAVGDAKPEAEAAVKAWSDIFGSVMDGLSAGFGLTELSAFLANFTGFNFAVLGPKLNLLIANLIEVARRFGTQAANSGIQEAWADAASRVSGLFSDAASSLKDALDLGAALLDPETQIPSIGQIQGKVDALFNIIQGVAAQFAARASAAANAGMNFEQVGGFAETVKSVFEGIREVAAAIADFTGVSLGASGFNNISQVLNAVFTLFEQVAGRASVVNQVSAAIASVLGGLANMVDAQAYQAGVDIGTRIADGIAAGLSGAVGVIGASIITAANTTAAPGLGQGTTVAVGGAGGGGGANVTYVYNTDNSKNITVSQVINTTPDNVGKAAGGMYPLLAGY